jgi:hypothetical protein
MIQKAVDDAILSGFSLLFRVAVVALKKRGNPTGSTSSTSVPAVAAARMSYFRSRRTVADAADSVSAPVV